MDTANNSRYGFSWTRDELILAFELYCRIPFQRTKATNPEVQKLSSILGRTPAAVARKLGNFGAFDPVLRRSKITGLTHTSKLDREIWDEFHNNWGGLVWQANSLRRTINLQIPETTLFSLPSGPSEILRITKQRVHQAFFRDAVMSSYNYTCCITGLTVKECLIASHIVPWSISEEYRADPTNGLCLSSTFDRLFDSGMITISSDMNVKVSERLLKTKATSTHDLICCYNGKAVIAPNRFLPASERLEWHRTYIFKG
jgi:putative restriction endonuclease